MPHTLLLSSLTLLAVFSLSHTPFVSGSASCGNGVQCGSATPCCSEYGFCGTGSYCLAGCDPIASYTPNSCAPTPTCQDHFYSFNSLNQAVGNNNSSKSGGMNEGIVNGTVYNGNSEAADFILNQGHVEQTESGDLVLTLTEKGGGTKVSLSRLVWYGTITARIKTSNWPGVVTAFITMSGVRDEIDWEFPGNNSLQGQTNYFWEGLVDYTHGSNATIPSARDTNWHDYTIDWQPDVLTWKVDNQTIKTLTRESTLNTSTGLYQYPQTPSQIQLSIWPGGLAGSAAGTITWAGGAIDWSNSDYKSNGYYYAQVRSLTVKCSTPGLLASSLSSDNNTTSSVVSFEYYNNSTRGDPSVKLSTNPTMIYSQQGTGLDMTRGKPWFSGNDVESAVIGGGALQGPRVGALLALTGVATFMVWLL